VQHRLQKQDTVMREALPSAIGATKDLVKLENI
jgi:hypothetical protein